MFIRVDDAQIFTTTFGSPSAPPFLALSGWIGSWEDWVDTLSPLSQCWHTIAYDHRGSGATQTSIESISMDSLVDDVFAVMDAFKVEQCVLAAMSMGAAVALQAALKRPERFTGLVIVNGLYYRPPTEEDIFLEGLRYNYASALDYFADSCVPEEDGAAVKQWGRQILDRATQEAAIHLYELASSIDLRAEIGRIEHPTLVIHGAADPLVPLDAARWLANTLPHGTLTILPDAGHVPIMTRPQLVAREINAFFKR